MYKTVTKLALIAGTLALVGAGCLPFGKSTDTSATDGGVFKTADAGDNWTQQKAIPSASGVGSIGPTNIMVMEMDPQDHEAIYIGTRENGLLYSYNAAASWHQPKLDALKEGTITAIDVDPKDLCTVYVAKGTRLYKTDNCLRTFDTETYVETRNGVAPTVVAVDWYNSQVVWLGLSNGDVLKSEDAGQSWRTVLNAGTDITAILINNVDSRMVLVGTDRDGLQKTVDSGATWTHIEDQLKDFRNGSRVSTLVQDSSSSTVIAATGYGLLRTKDFGETWEAITLLTSPGQVVIKALGIDPSDANKIYYAASTTFYSTTTGGAPWTTTTVPTTRQPSALLIDPTNASIQYLGVMSVEK